MIKRAGDQRRIELCGCMIRMCTCMCMPSVYIYIYIDVCVMQNKSHQMEFRWCNMVGWCNHNAVFCKRAEVHSKPIHQHFDDNQQTASLETIMTVKITHGFIWNAKFESSDIWQSDTHTHAHYAMHTKLFNLIRFYLNDSITITIKIAVTNMPDYIPRVEKKVAEIHWTAIVWVLDHFVCGSQLQIDAILCCWKWIMASEFECASCMECSIIIQWFGLVSLQHPI